MSDYRFEDDKLTLLEGNVNNTTLYPPGHPLGVPFTATTPRLDATYTPSPLVGLKFDNGKPRMDLVPPELMKAVATILAFGANKYGDRNWEKGMDWGRPYSALLRHLLAWWGGEDNDPETGLSHLWHVATNAAFLLTYEERKIGNDNRPK